MPPLGILMPPPQHARARAVRLVTGAHTRTPPHPQSVGTGPRQPAQRAGSRGCESARPRTPHTQAGGAPLARPSCRSHSAQSQLARARAVGLVTGPHARTPRHPQQVGSGPRQPAQRAGSRGWESARPRTPHTQARGAPIGHPHAPCTARKSARCGVGDRSPRPHPPAPTASGWWAPAARPEGGQSDWESARPRTPHIQAGGAPPGRPPAAPTARKASSQECALWGW